MKKEITIDGKTYVLKEESKCTSKSKEEFKVGDWVIFNKSGGNIAREFPLHIPLRINRLSQKFQSPGDCNAYFEDGNAARLSTVDGGYQLGKYEKWFRRATKEEIETYLLEEAKRRYPVGTKFYPAHVDEGIVSYIVKGKWRLNSNRERIWVEINGLETYVPNIYYQGKWAEIIKEEELEVSGYKIQKEKDGIKIGCEFFSTSELSSIFRLFNISKSENLTIEINGDELGITKEGECDWISYDKLFKNTLLEKF